MHEIDSDKETTETFNRVNSYQKIYGFDIAGHRLSIQNSPDLPDEPDPEHKRTCEECIHYENHNSYMCRKCSPKFNLWFPIDGQTDCQDESLAESPGIKQDTDKLRLDLIDPVFMKYLAFALGYGAKKYDDHNWLRGMQWTRVYGALLRHLHSWYAGEEIDLESGNPHLAHAAAMLMFLVRYSYEYPNYDQFDDRPFKEEEKKVGA